MNLSINVEMVTHRCDRCGRWWAIEKGPVWGSCPSCKSRYQDDLEKRFTKANRTIAGLRGAAKRREKR